jgi:hypothetical protein
VLQRTKSKEGGTSKKPPKLHYIAQQELRKKINEHEKMQRDAHKSSPLSDYERSLDKSYKESRKAKRAGKDIAQLRQQSKQSIDPLVVEGDCANAQGSPIDKEALEDFLATTGLTAEQLIGGASIPTKDYDIYQTYVYGQNLVNPKYCSSLCTQMFLLNKWYLKVTANDEAAWLVARVRPEHYLG